MNETFVGTGHDSSEVMLFGANIKDSPIITTNYIQSKQLPPDHNGELDVVHHFHAHDLKRIKRGKGILCFSL